MPRLPLVVALCLALPALLEAQDPGFELAPGERIEIDAPGLDPRLVPATVTRWGGSWVGFSLDDDGREWTRHLYLVDRIRVRRAIPPGERLRRGAVWGLFLGTSVGGIASPFLARVMEGETDPWRALSVGAGGGALLGTATGALIGALVPRSAWMLYLFRPSAGTP